ncbi:MAG: hypothetical protein JSW63_10995 [Ignavibacterium sp.]|nr:MAG: hypothetical protein JSW63_10995 [Ignavibacterium sp.]
MKTLFYIFKLFIPRSVQIFLRRKLVEKKRKRFKDVWPVLPSAAKKPANWKGWPDGKRFTFILTYDVELQHGHDKCKQLMQIDENPGFVFSFNFVPERYTVSPEFRKNLEINEFEVGELGLNHDGKFFQYKKTFDERAVKINKYIKIWNSVGFRAQKMLNNLS